MNRFHYFDPMKVHDPLKWVKAVDYLPVLFLVVTTLVLEMPADARIFLVSLSLLLFFISFLTFHVHMQKDHIRLHNFLYKRKLARKQSAGWTVDIFIFILPLPGTGSGSKKGTG
jgi:hypothetical protein